MRKIAIFMLCLFLIALFTGCKPNIEKASVSEYAFGTPFKPYPTTNLYKCPIRIAMAFYAYIHNSMDNTTSMDNLYLQIISRWKNKIISKVYINVEAYDKYGNQIINKNQKSIMIVHEEAIDYGQCSKEFFHKISGFTGASIYRIRVAKVLTADGQEWLAQDNGDYLDVEWNGRITGQIDKGITNEYVKQIQSDILNRLSLKGLKYSPVEPLIYYGGVKSLWDSVQFLLQYSDFEVKLSGDTEQSDPKKGLTLTCYLNVVEDEEKIKEIALAVLPVVCNVTEEQAIEIVGIVESFLVVKEDIHRKSLSFLLPCRLNTVTLDSLNQDIHHLFTDVVDVGKVLKDTAL